MQQRRVRPAHTGDGNRYEGLLDMVVDGPAGSGRTILLRAIGRGFQQKGEKHSSDRILVVHITAPHAPAVGTAQR
ncbi:hypothetical protein ACFWOB_13900 [Streptomyces sp. NPDC058420]|uniref:hypothetical protein n=1 Tax=Streptomyces sp. NPDC058420 TaxID=3346489 RepID=UPI0036661B7F